MTLPIITAKQLCASYDKQLALNHIDLTIGAGEIVGLIGPNGAGKTTLLKAFMGLIDHQGELRILGNNPRQNPRAILNDLCFIADVAILPRWLTVTQLLDFVAGVHANFNRSKAISFIEKTNIVLNSKLSSLSKGMIVQLHLSLIMAIDAKVLILDEPTLGLDILYRKRFYQSLLNDYFDKERTIIISSHQVEEIEQILTRVIFLDQGKICLDRSMEDFSAQFINVTAGAETAARLRTLSPLQEQTFLGKTLFLFENTPKEVLAALGEISTPSISDVFISKIDGAHA